MKHVTAVFVLFFLAGSLYGQEETLFDDKIEHGGFGGPAVRFSNFMGNVGVMVGGYGGWLIDHRLMIGGGGFGLVTEHRARPEAEYAYSTTSRRLYSNFGYGGVMLEYILMPNKLVHVYVNALIGAGAVSYRFGGSDPFNDEWTRNTDSFFVLEPFIAVELNVVSWMRFSAGAGYRYVSGAGDLIGVSNADLTRPTFGATIKFGSF